MNCKECGGETFIKDSRKRGKLGVVRRKRYCVVCGETFDTIEVRANEATRVVDIDELTRTMEHVGNVWTSLGIIAKQAELQRPLTSPGSRKGAAR